MNKSTNDYVIEELRVIQQKPPWYWRLVGRRYWKGWVVQGYVTKGTKGNYFSTQPSPVAPTPELATTATVQGVLEAVNRFELYTEAVNSFHVDVQL